MVNILQLQKSYLENIKKINEYHIGMVFDDIFHMMNQRKYLYPAFKRCPSCGKVWSTKENFLRDNSLFLNGYQQNRDFHENFPKKLIGRLTSAREGKIDMGRYNEYQDDYIEKRPGYLIFTHTDPGCGTTMAVCADLFQRRVRFIEGSNA